MKDQLKSLTKVHLYYENWVKSSMSDNCLKFQELWELIMVRSTSEAKCETVGSMILQHTGKNRHLEPENFNKELFLRVNLGPMHILKGLVNEVLAKDYKEDERTQNLLGPDNNIDFLKHFINSRTSNIASMLD